MELEFKSLDRSAAVVTDVDEDGTFEAIVAVTNIKDDVGDIIKAGAFEKSLKKRTPKGISAHDWKTPIARTIEIKELPPGDPWIQAEAPDIAAKGGGVLYVKGRYVLGTQAGSEARVLHQEFKDDLAWSIGYGVPAGAAKHVRGVRELKELDVHEYSQVIVGAMPLARGISVKSAVTDPAQLETKRNFTKAERDKAADSGAALPDGSFPIYNAEDLGNAINLAHNAKNPARAKRHIKKRAAALGLTGKLPDDWKSVTPEDAETKALTLKQRDGRFYMVPSGTEDDADLDEVAVRTFDSEAEAVNALRAELADERESRDDIDEDDPLGDEPAPPYAGTKDVSTGSAPGATGRGFGQGPLGALHQFRPRPDDPRRCRFCDEGVDGGMHVELDAEEEKQLLHPFIGDPDHEACEACGQIKDYELFAIHNGLEVKARGGHDRNRGNAETLRRYWTVGAGGQRIRWGVPGDFMRCVTLVSKHMSRRRAKGYCALRHKETTGHWTGDRENHGGKSLYLEGGLAPDGVTDEEYRDLIREQSEVEAAGGVFDPPALDDADEEKALDAYLDALEDAGLQINGYESKVLRAGMRAIASVLGPEVYEVKHDGPWTPEYQPGKHTGPKPKNARGMSPSETRKRRAAGTNSAADKKRQREHGNEPASASRDTMAPTTDDGANVSRFSEFTGAVQAGKADRIDFPEAEPGGPPAIGRDEVRKGIGWREGVAGGEIRVGDYIEEGTGLERVTKVTRTAGFGDEAEVETASGRARRVSSVNPANVARPPSAEDREMDRQMSVAEGLDSESGPRATDDVWGATAQSIADTVQDMRARERTEVGETRSQDLTAADVDDLVMQHVTPALDGDDPEAINAFAGRVDAARENADNGFDPYEEDETLGNIAGALADQFGTDHSLDLLADTLSRRKRDSAAESGPRPKRDWSAAMPRNEDSGVDPKMSDADYERETALEDASDAANTRGLARDWASGNDADPDNLTESDVRSFSDAYGLDADQTLSDLYDGEDEYGESRYAAPQTDDADFELEREDLLESMRNAADDGLSEEDFAAFREAMASGDFDDDDMMGAFETLEELALDAGYDVTGDDDDDGPKVNGKIPEIAGHEDDLMSVARRNGGNVKPARAAAHIRLRAREQGGSRESAMRRVADAIEGRGKVGPTDVHWLKADRWNKHEHSAYDAPLGIALADYIDYDTGGLDFTHLDELMLALPEAFGGKDLQGLMDEQKSLEATLGDD